MIFLIILALNLDLSPVALDKLLRDKQADAGAHRSTNPFR